jgi:hypothetical protein
MLPLNCVKYKQCSLIDISNYLISTSQKKKIEYGHKT